MTGFENMTENRPLSHPKMPNIFLIGFMGAGKTTIAAHMHARYGMKILEMDEEIVRREKMPIPQLFAARGEAYFRAAETALLEEIEPDIGMVVSCGGGVAMRDENVRMMKKRGRIILLSASPQTILDRVQKDHDRPLLEGKKDLAHITELMDRRRAAYQAAADLVVETDGKDVDAICALILAEA